MSCHPRQATLLGPAAISIHDDGNVLWNAVQINLLKKLLFDRAPLKMACETGLNLRGKDGHIISGLRLASCLKKGEFWFCSQPQPPNEQKGLHQ